MGLNPPPRKVYKNFWVYLFAALLSMCSLKITVDIIIIVTITVKCWCELCSRMHHFEGENTKLSGEGAQLPSQTPPPLGKGKPLPKLHPIGTFGTSIRVPSALELPKPHFWLRA